jgi:hypothetical protein
MDTYYEGDLYELAAATQLAHHREAPPAEEARLLAALNQALAERRQACKAAGVAQQESRVSARKLRLAVLFVQRAKDWAERRVRAVESDDQGAIMSDNQLVDEAGDVVSGVDDPYADVLDRPC